MFELETTFALFLLLLLWVFCLIFVDRVRESLYKRRKEGGKKQFSILYQALRQNKRKVHERRVRKKKEVTGKPEKMKARMLLMVASVLQNELIGAGLSSGQVDPRSHGSP